MDHNTIETVSRQDRSTERPQASSDGVAVTQTLAVPGTTGVNLTLGGFAAKTTNTSMAAGGSILSGNTVQTTVNVRGNLIWQGEHGQGPVNVAQEINLQKLKRCPNPSQRFTGRQDAIEKMKAYFFSGTDERRVFVLHGLGGAGKTQIASKFIHEYCYRKPKEGDAQRILVVFYINATSSETLESSFSEAAVSAGIGKDKTDVLTWLSHCEDAWLLFLDNADDPSLDLNGYFPSAPSGNILITTRNSHAPSQYTDGDSASSYAVGGMTPDDAELFLSRLTRSSGSSTEGIEILAKELGYLALALAQAGSAICECRWSVADYLELFKKRKSKVFQDDETRPQGVDGYARTVYTTWLISYEKLSPLARRIFQMCSHLHYDGISEKMFQQAIRGLSGFNADDALPLTVGEKAAVEELNALLGNFGENSEGELDLMKFRGVMRELMGYSLIEEQFKSYRIHQLVHQWTQALNLEIKDLHLCTMLLLASAARENKDMLYALSLIPHANHLLKAKVTIPAVVAQIFGSSIYCMAGFFTKAEPLLRYALDIMMMADGNYDLQRCQVMVHLGDALQQNGQFVEAGKILREALEKQRAILGDDYLDTVRTMYSVASNLNSTGQFQKAEKMYKHVLEKRKQLLGEDHPGTLSTMHNLALSLNRQGQFQEAEKMFRHMLEKEKQLLGGDHPGTLTTMHSLALSLDNQGQFQEAEKMYRHVLEKRKQLLGEDHPGTLTTMHSLALSLNRQGQFQEAETSFHSLNNA